MASADGGQSQLMPPSKGRACLYINLFNLKPLFAEPTANITAQHPCEIKIISASQRLHAF